MPREQISSKTGNAEQRIMRQGHTATNNHGSNPNLKAKGRGEPRNLNIK
jgi:hypothetical protein